MSIVVGLFHLLTLVVRHCDCSFVVLVHGIGGEWVSRPLNRARWQLPARVDGHCIGEAVAVGGPGGLQR
jgi:hypothetical protein